MVIHSGRSAEEAEGRRTKGAEKTEGGFHRRDAESPRKQKARENSFGGAVVVMHSGRSAEEAEGRRTKGAEETEGGFHRRDAESPRKQKARENSSGGFVVVMHSGMSAEEAEGTVVIRNGVRSSDRHGWRGGQAPSLQSGRSSQGMRP